MDQGRVQSLSNWAIDWDGVTWHRDDLTVAHARVVSELIGDDTWAWVDLSPTRGPLAFLAVLVAFIAVDNQLDAQGVTELVASLSSVTLDHLLESFRPIIDEVT